ncbi:hypothetical protein [Maritalea porphyrae]|uniref:hypothetical protein n=1 Tax=Maritalea porphyrae TaxID=880732 RepID=UPI0022AEFB34|nr:hypothetical protein [Maritalea porphyrae]MCZ4273793.1 hypothetical protein [Maritalea porphyrae]
MTFQERFSAHLFHRSNWWLLVFMVWAAIHWKFDLGGEFALENGAFPPLILLLCYFTLSPAFFFALAGVNPEAASRSWGYLVEATWPIYVLDHMVNLATLTALHALMGAPLGWGLFLPLTQTVYLTFYAARGYVRRIGYYKFDDKRDDI